MILMLISLFWYTKWMFIAAGCSLILQIIGVMLLNIVMCKLGGYPIKRMKLAILLSPLFMVSWIPLQILALFKPVKRWSPIEHKGQKDKI